jgi:hypothetical protein
MQQQKQTPYGMTNKRTGNRKDEIQGFFPFGKLRVRMTA